MKRGWLVSGGLIGLLLLDAVLIALALNRPDPPSTQSVVVVDDAGSAEPTAPATGQPTASPTVTAAEPPRGVRLVRMLDAVSADVAWRAQAGACPTQPGQVEVSTDGGAGWAPVWTDGEVLRVKATDASSAFVVASQGADCAAAFTRTRDGGAAWTQDAGSLRVAWHLEGEGADAVVHAPGGTRPGPCPGGLVDLAPVTTARAGALCADGGVHLTEDSAATWGQVTAVPGAVALTDAGDGFVVAVLGAAGCETGIQAVAAAAQPEVRGCLEVAGAAPGQVTLSAAGDALWIWAGERVAVSPDGGRSWE